MQDCAGFWGGSSSIDLCGNCISTGGYCYSEYDEADYQVDVGVCCDDAPINEYGECVSNSDYCVEDCSGEWGGDVVVDDCGLQNATRATFDRKLARQKS